MMRITLRCFLPQTFISERQLKSFQVYQLGIFYKSSVNLLFHRLKVFIIKKLSALTNNVLDDIIFNQPNDSFAYSLK